MSDSTGSDDDAKAKSVRKRKDRTATVPGKSILVTDDGQLALFVPTTNVVSIKDDIASMEVPIFSLGGGKGKDTGVREYTRGNKKVKIIPSAEGCATMFDKNLLIYIQSHMAAAMNDGRPVTRTIKIETSKFFTATKKTDGGRDYETVVAMLRRLRGTTIETNIPTGGKTQTKGFALIDSYEVIEEQRKIKTDPKSGAEIEALSVVSFEVTISEWLMNGIAAFEVLTLDDAYFEIKKPINRRLYEVARKYCGVEKAMWKINIDQLAEKIGARGGRAKFREDLRNTIKNDLLPQYRVALEPQNARTRKEGEDVVFLTKDGRRLTKWLASGGDIPWYNTLIQRGQGV